MRIYAIGDIHGQRAMLESAHQRIETDRALTGDRDAPVIHLGDLVDRGPDSRGVIQFLVDGTARGKPWIVLKGNHDQAFAAQLGIGGGLDVSYHAWAADSMGGAATARSYGVEHDFLFGWPTEGKARRQLRAAVPDDHKRFLEELPLTYETDELLFVHAGIRPGLALSEQLEDDLLWIRREFLADRRDHGKLIVHGHTPVDMPMHCGNRVNLDTGAGYGHPLTAAVFEDRKAWVLDPFEGRVPLSPP